MRKCSHINIASRSLPLLSLPHCIDSLASQPPPMPPPTSSLPPPSPTQPRPCALASTSELGAGSLRSRAKPSLAAACQSPPSSPPFTPLPRWLAHHVPPRLSASGGGIIHVSFWLLCVFYCFKSNDSKKSFRPQLLPPLGSHPQQPPWPCGGKTLIHPAMPLIPYWGNNFVSCWLLCALYCFENVYSNTILLFDRNSSTTFDNAAARVSHHGEWGSPTSIHHHHPLVIFTLVLGRMEKKGASVSHSWCWRWCWGQADVWPWVFQSGAVGSWRWGLDHWWLVKISFAWWRATGGPICPRLVLPAS